MPTPCPCDSGKPFAQCCQPYLNNTTAAPTAEALMRSRYTAYTHHNRAYLLATWHPDHRPADFNPEPLRWLGLKILHTHRGTATDNNGTVHFIARYKGEHGRAYKLEEHSEFIKQDGHWYYCRALALPPATHLKQK